MRNLAIVGVIVLLVAAATYVLLSSNSDKLESETSTTMEQEQSVTVLAEITKYYNQPLSLFESDWPTASPSTDGRRMILKNDVWSLVAAMREGEQNVYYLQGQSTRDMACGRRNKSEQLEQTLEMFGLVELLGVEPTSNVADSQLYCVEEDRYSVNVSCLFGSNTYTISVSGFDEDLCK